MSLNSVRFACTALNGTNKVGTLKPDKDGYYPMVVGALNMFNSAGHFYVYEQAKELFSSSSQFMRRVSKGALRGEYGHPKQEPGMDEQAFARRVLTIYEERACCHHKEIWIDTDNVKDNDGKPIIAIMSKVYPSGPYGTALEKSLNNPSENVCFSIRSFTDDYMVRGIKNRVLKTIVTFDMVNEPGMAIATKYSAPALEDMSEQTFSKSLLQRSVRSNEVAGIATESAILTADELWTAMNWDTSHMKPHYTNW